MHSQVHAIDWQQQHLRLLDQRQLPHQQHYIDCYNAQDVADAIRDMVVRGAPAIGIAAAYGYALEALHGGDLQHAYQVLAESRPTAVNLFWALDRMVALNHSSHAELVAEARRIHSEDIAANQTMAQFGASLLGEGSHVYTHCNTGALATGGHGTALGVIRSAWQDGKLAQVFAGETRPWLQGARLTCWELMQEQIPVTLVCDGAAAHVMKQQQQQGQGIDWIIVGADRIAANGDVANKIGTYSLAVLAKHHGAKLMVVAPSSSFDLSIANGDDIVIEQRPATEVTELHGSAIAPSGCDAANPSFDVTPAELITAIVCEKGIIPAPSTEVIASLLSR
ncbi:S-methyl-5-thioribose-1-phosphate isomerase [Bacterioplanes sanyensis]|uniref:Methylthioribose-1-phosphate isomerase n=1 Tax=Bacterioplanes sanyensis TaxID=1249553 RepID=A0A222FQB2_9GAMM|nr:S-methyl-5-thioribose-1-phosphate isomerase [Bacterioplanes sanyensis]ASP40714.1 S-methyl-5-thioribose-1-phosphate isomerase [Bacterioplanes sanyensis]